VFNYRIQYLSRKNAGLIMKVKEPFFILSGINDLSMIPFFRMMIIYLQDYHDKHRYKQREYTQCHVPINAGGSPGFVRSKGVSDFS
jgi:hypothetical protein